MSGGEKSPVDRETRNEAVEKSDSSLCLEAGAGTGKTTLLVKRYISIIAGGGAGCTGIVAITFTEAAASEMKERIRGKLKSMLNRTGRSEGEEGPLSTEAEDRMREAISQIEAAPVTTIHSFASSIIRDYPVEADIDPDFSIITEADYDIFRKRCWDDFLAERGSSFSSEIGAYLRIGGSLEKLEVLSRKYYDARFERHVSRFRTTGRGARPGPPAGQGDSFYDIFSQYTKKLEKLALKHCIDGGDKGKRDIEKLRDTLEAASSLNTIRREEFLLGAKIPHGSGARPKWKPAEKSDLQKKLRKKLAGIQKEYRCRYVDNLRDRLELMLNDYLEFVDRRKQKEGKLDFDDLLIRMRELMRNGEVVDSLRKRFRYILVDEFQDTNSIQAEIIFTLAGLIGGRAKKSSGASLFIVGDPKQSIYRFRKANVEVYEEVKSDFSGQDSYRSIKQNFRSGKNLLDWVNAAFSNLIQEPESGRFQPKYEPVLPYREDGENGVILLDLDRGDEKLKVDQLRQREGIATARMIRHLVESERKIRDFETGEFRPVRYGDIALIYRQTTGLEYYEAPLKSEEIPYVVCGGGLFFAAQEVRDLANAVWAIENHWDPVYLTAVLRSTIFGFSDEEIYMFRKAGGELDYLSEKVPEGSSFEHFREAFKLLRSLHNNRNRRGAAATLTELIRRTGYREVNIFRSHSTQRLGNIEKVIRKGRDFDCGLNSFRQFALWFKDQEKLGTREGEYSLLDRDQNAVKLLTIHKSKGQQFPVVFMMNLEQEIKDRDSFFIEGGAGPEFRIAKGWHTSGFEDYKNRNQERESAEIFRLLYVSATRAGDILVIPDVRNISKKKTYFKLLEHYLPDVNEGTASEKGAGAAPEAAGLVKVQGLSPLPSYSGIQSEYKEIPPPGSAPRVEGDRQMREWIEKREALIGKRSGEVPVITPSSGKNLHAGMIESSADRKLPGAEAASFGTAFHSLMEMIDFDDISGLEEKAVAAASENGLEEMKDELAALARKALSSELLLKVSEADIVLREVPFSVPLKAGMSPENRSYLAGKVDLLFRCNGEWTAVDYKTDDISDPEGRFEQYRLQGLMYLAGLRKLGIELNGGMIFFFVRPGSEVRLTPEDLEHSDLPPELSEFI